MNTLETVQNPERHFGFIHPIRDEFRGVDPKLAGNIDDRTRSDRMRNLEISQDSPSQWMAWNRGPRSIAQGFIRLGSLDDQSDAGEFRSDRAGRNGHQEIIYIRAGGTPE
jgi:hypothetical protein